MRAKKGGYAVQRLYHAEGRTGPRHPAHYAANQYLLDEHPGVTRPRANLDEPSPAATHGESYLRLSRNSIARSNTALSGRTDVD